MTTTAVLLVVAGRPTTAPVKALLPPTPPLQPRLVLLGFARWAGMLAAAWTAAALLGLALYTAATALFQAVADIATSYP